jgi:hypothetical protein
MVVLYFSDGRTEYRLSVTGAPKRGEVLRRGEDEWIVDEIEREGTRTSVSLRPLQDGLSDTALRAV